MNLSMKLVRWLAFAALALPIGSFAPGCGCTDAPTASDAGSVTVPPPDDEERLDGCLVDDDCPFGDVCRSGACRPSETTQSDNGCWSDDDCSADTRCAVASGRCVDAASFPDAPASDDDADCDENETRFCGTKVGACEYGVERCSDGAWTGVCEDGVRPAADESCDGLDNDCDGETDEGFALAVECAEGVGVCRQTGVTVCSADGTSAVCSAVALSAEGRVELCDNSLDDDCDEEVDEGFVLSTACEVGMGACRRTGVTTCSEDLLSTVCSATPGIPAAAELCGNDPDDDCDGVLDEDEGFASLSDACEVGIGACRRTGQRVCTADELSVRCSANAGTPAADELCGGDPDEDCDSELEEGFTTLGSGCFVGAGDCQVPGLLACNADRTLLQCAPTAGGTEVCDGADNDADTCEDEDFDVGVACAVGDGVCRDTGFKICTDDETGTECDATPLPANAAGELCGNDLDDDCNGEVDEGFPTLNNSCAVGVGICRRTGSEECSSDGLSTVCGASAGDPDPYGELCGNNKDDDCNGEIDDGFDLNVPCSVGEGTCQRTGVTICALDGKGTVCSVTAAQPHPDGELCGNGLDDDCNGEVDEGYGIGDACDVGLGICNRTGVLICDGLLAAKCSVNAGPQNPAGELCANGDDDDCDGFTDEGFGNLNDDCQVGLGECSKTGVYVCSQDLTATVCSVNPGLPVPEVCDNKDNDCNAVPDNGCDDDGDDYCDVNMTFSGTGTVTVCPLSNASSLDCNDGDANVNPGEDEICFDARDQNCNGNPDDGCPVCDNSVDRDFDGVNECLDCDDTNGAVFPSATERCDGLDNDCDGNIDESFDGDDDGYTTCGTIPTSGGLDPSYIDCNDALPNVHPFACELCSLTGGANAACGDIGNAGNGIDEDCDGYFDESCAPCSNVDSDDDGLSQCEGDCAPSDPSRYPGNGEVCDGKDNDCNLFTTDNCGVGDECNWPGDPSPDACKEDLFCVEELTGGGGGSGNYHCTSWCNSTPLNLGLGDGCAAGETCSSRITPTANMHGCNTGTVVGTKATGVDCAANTECRSGWCLKDQRYAGKPLGEYCSDYCGSDAYCPSGTYCQASANDTGRCLRTYSFQDTDIGGACPSTSDCIAGNRACLTINGTATCSKVCCTNSDCPNDWYCSLNGNVTGGPNGGVDTVPMCWPESGSNGDRPAGAQCSNNAQCASEFCDKTLNQCIDVCCNDDTCPAGLACQDTIVTLDPDVVGMQTFARVCVNVTPTEPLEKK